MSDFTDKRHSFRCPCDILVEYEITGVRPREGRMTEIGTGGASLTTQEAISVGTHLIPRFQVPLGKRLTQAVGVVKWAKERTVGLEFVGLTHHDAEEIWRYYAMVSAQQRRLGA